MSRVLKFGNHTRTRRTRGPNTVGLPEPVLFLSPVVRPQEHVLAESTEQLQVVVDLQLTWPR